MSNTAQHINIFESFKTPMKRINEDASNNDYIFEGVCADFSDTNRNGRTYDKEEYLGFVNGSLADQISQMSLAGSLDHPDDAEDEEKDIFTPKMRELSHVILALWYDEEAQQVKIKIKLLDTHLGKDAKAVADAGMPIYISSRASGIIGKKGDVHLDNIHTYDIVYKPGFKQAKLNRIFEKIFESESSFIRIFENTDNMETYYILYDYKKGTYGYDTQSSDFNWKNATLPDWQEFTGKSFTDQNQASLYCKDADITNPSDFTPNEEKIKQYRNNQSVMESVSKKEFESVIGKINESLIIISKSIKGKNKFAVNESKFMKRLKRFKINEEETEQLDKQDVVALVADVTEAPIEDVAKAVTDEVVDKVNDVLNDENVFDKVVEIIEENMDELVAEDEADSPTKEQSKQEIIKFLSSINNISEDEASSMVTDEMITNYEASKAECNGGESAESINESLVKRFNKTFRKIYEAEETLEEITNFMHESELKLFNQALQKFCDSGETLYHGVTGVGELELKKNTENNTIEVSKESGKDDAGEPAYTMIGSIPCDKIKSVNENLKSRYIKESEEIGNAEEFIATSDATAEEKVGIIKSFNDLYGADYDIIEGGDEQTVESFLQEQNQLTIEAVSQKSDLAIKQGIDKTNIISKRINNIQEYVGVVVETVNNMYSTVESQGKMIQALIEQVQIVQTRLNTIAEFSNVIVSSVNQTADIVNGQTSAITESKKIAEKRKQVFESLDDKINKIITNAVNEHSSKANKDGVLINEVPAKFAKVFEALDERIQDEIKAYIIFKNPKSNLELEAIWESMKLDKGGANNIAIFESTNFEYSDDYIKHMLG